MLVRTRAVSICGSDIPYFTRGAAVDGHARVGYPAHEMVGDVVASRDPGTRPGDRVVGWASSADALAELVVTSGSGLAVCDPTFPPERVVLAQPLACVLQAVDRLPQLRDVDAAIIGLGPIGLLFGHVMSSRGAARITGIDPVDRSSVTAEFGITDFVQSTSTTWAATIEGGECPTVVIEAVGHQVATLSDALSAVSVGGTVYAFGIPHPEDYPLNVTTLVRNNLTLLGGITTDRRRYLQLALEYLQRHPDLPDVLITDVMPSTAAQTAYEAASQPRRDRLKVTLTFHDPGDSNA